nr:putative ZCF37 [Tanacetum cinerariifolium]
MIHDTCLIYLAFYTYSDLIFPNLYTYICCYLFWKRPLFFKFVSMRFKRLAVFTGCYLKVIFAKSKIARTRADAKNKQVVIMVTNTATEKEKMMPTIGLYKEAPNVKVHRILTLRILDIYDFPFQPFLSTIGFRKGRGITGFPYSKVTTGGEDFF